MSTHRRKPKAKPLLGHGHRSLIKSERHPVRLFGADLQDAREEMFVRMVADGLSMGVAYERAGFVSKGSNAATSLYSQPHIQRRIEAVLEARRTQGVVTLPEVTDMLKRVFAGANSEGEYSAAHNAAFSLARLYGHVTDRSTLEVMRRPSRDPDAPSEQALGAWVDGLGPVIEGSMGPSEGSNSPSNSPTPSPSAAPLGLEPPSPSAGCGQAVIEPWTTSPELTAVNSSESSNDINGLAVEPGPDGIGNRVPTRPVTGTPSTGGHPPPLEKRPMGTNRVPVKKRVKSGAQKRKLRAERTAQALKAQMKDLFG